MTLTETLDPRATRERRLTPSAWVVVCSTLIAPGGRVLDVACGSGRHSRLLASNGFQVVAVDRDRASIALLEGLTHVDARCADLEVGNWPLGDERFDAVVVTNYLYRPLLEGLHGALVPNGIIIYETFMRGNERIGRPSRPEFLLESGELRDWARGLGMEVIAFEEGETHEPRHAVVQRLCARRAAS